jgi:hypothetical protein
MRRRRKIISIIPDRDRDMVKGGANVIIDRRQPEKGFIWFYI